MTVKPNKKIAFFGTGGVFSNIVLQNLIKQNIYINMVFILIKPNSTLRPLNQDFCVERNIAYELIDDTNTSYVKKILQDKQIDLGVVASYSQILKEDVLKSTRDGFINLHPSFLPYYKGANPLFWQIKDGKDEIGATVHIINTKIDDGCILVRDKWPITNILSGEKILRFVAVKGSNLLGRILSNYINGFGLISLESIEENELESGFYNPKPTEKDFEIDLTITPPDKLHVLVMRIRKWGELFFFYNGNRYFILNVEIFNQMPKTPTEIRIIDNRFYVNNHFGCYLLETKSDK